MSRISAWIDQDTTTRLLAWAARWPTRRADGTSICRDCAGITRSFFCDRCGFEGLLCRGRLCERCTLTDKLAAVLQRLAALDGAGQPHARLLRQFGVWQQLPRLRAKARTRPLTPAARRCAGEQFTQAQRFLAWVDALGRSPAEIQTDVDAWHTTQTWAVRHIDVVSRQDSSCCHQGGWPMLIERIITRMRQRPFDDAIDELHAHLATTAGARELVSAVGLDQRRSRNARAEARLGR